MRNTVSIPEKIAAHKRSLEWPDGLTPDKLTAVGGGASRHIVYWGTEEEARRVEALFASPVGVAGVKAGQLGELRAERNRLLDASDRLMELHRDLADLGRANKKAELLTYRQALRDLPATTKDPAAPAWPVKPEGT